MNNKDRRDLNAGLREDLATFIRQTFHTVAPGDIYHHNWHIDAIAWRLQQCAAGEIKRLVITVPPRNLKSICASVAFPAWVLGRNPSQRIITASYSAELAGKLARDCRMVMESRWYQEAFATRLSSEKNTEMHFATTRQGYRYAVSVGGSLTGFGGNILIVDDPLKPQDALSDTKRGAVNEWYNNTLYSRLDDKRDGVIILIMQRLHAEDLVGYLLERGSWVHLNLPALAEQEERILIGKDRYHTRAVGDVLHDRRESKAVLEDTRKRLGSFNFSAQYQQNPLPPDGGLLKWSWFRIEDTLPEREPGDSIVQSWDTASKPGENNDYSVCLTFLVKGNIYYLVDVLREKLNYPELKKTVVIHALKHKADTILIEDKNSGTPLIQELQRGGERGLAMPIGVQPEGDKLIRMCAQSAQIEAGHVRLPRNAAWLEDFKAEVLQFPRGLHDDQVDSLSQFLGWIQKRNGGSFSYCFVDPHSSDSEWRPKPLAAPPVIKPKVLVQQKRRDGSVIFVPWEF